MKYAFILISTLLCSTLFAQKVDTSRYIINAGIGYQYKGWKVDSALMIPKTGDTLSKSPGLIKIIPGTDLLAFVGSSNFWTILSPPDLSNYVQKQTQNPIATLTGGETRELMSSGADLSYTLSWSAGRAAATSIAQATANISTINVGGVNETFSNPSAGSTVSGAQAVTVVRNTNTSFTNTVTTSDSKIVTASTSVIFQPKRYWFYSTSATPASSDVIAALGGNSELSTSISKSNFTITSSGGNQYFSYAYPSSEGALSSINIGGFESIGSFTQRTVSVTNASGYVQNYYVYTSNNQLPTTTINSVQ